MPSPSAVPKLTLPGFSRFMLDDLQAHPDGRNKSKSQRKRLAESVALEMMRRNQAYSHLVELVMPRQVRLSIHAHNNAGPKFAVSLLPKSTFRPLSSVSQWSSRRHCANSSSSTAYTCLLRITCMMSDSTCTSQRHGTIRCWKLVTTKGGLHMSAKQVSFAKS
jgi:pyoverdine/dityrosine biosynthesis protein Dit1